MDEVLRVNVILHYIIVYLISYEDMDQVTFLIFRQLPIFDGFIKSELKYYKTDYSLNRPRTTDQIKVHTLGFFFTSLQGQD